MMQWPRRKVMNTMGVPNNKKRSCDEVAYKEDQKRTFIPMYHFKRGRQERNKRERETVLYNSPTGIISHGKQKQLGLHSERT